MTSRAAAMVSPVNDDAIEAMTDKRAGLTPSERIYQKRERRTRDVATAFLLDMSASTDEEIEKRKQKYADDDDFEPLRGASEFKALVAPTLS